jgi:hypothetical protein
MLLVDRDAEDQLLIGRGLTFVISPNSWSSLHPNKREALAQEANHYIRQSYGLKPKPVAIAVDWPDHRLGVLNPDDSAVLINARVLYEADPTDLLRTLAHENRHDVQLERLSGRMPLPNDSAEAIEELGFWSDAYVWYGHESAVAQRYNALEVDAESAARCLVDGYWRQVRAHEREQVSREIGR